nr:3',5'-cyclic adenosine monophosphate phosphodiesterase CpdA [uncultured bacterium]
MGRNSEFEPAGINRREFLAGFAAVGVGRRILARQLTTASVTLTRYPYIQNTRTDAATIMWAASGPADAVMVVTSDGVNFRYARPQMRTFTYGEVAPLSPFTQFRVDLSELDPATNYIYQLYIDSQLSTQGGFRTAGDGPFRFVVFGDSGQLTPGQLSIAQLIAAEPASFLMHAGDIAYTHGTQENFQHTYFDVYRQTLSSVPLFPCPGNHEYLSGSPAAYLASYAVPTGDVPDEDQGRYYSFDWANAHFVCLDSNESLQRALAGQGSMLKWLEADLRATDKFWRFATMHHPPYAGGPNQTDPVCAMVRQYVVPILEKHGVQLVFSGHEHSYQRTRPVRNGAAVLPGTGTVYMTSGGGGAALYYTLGHPLVETATSTHHYLRVDVSGTRLGVTAIDMSGNALEQYVVQPAPVLLDDPDTPAVSLVPSGLETLLRIRGYSFAVEETFVPAPPGAPELTSTGVFVNQRPVPLLYASPTQIWAELPSDIAPPFVLDVVTPNGSAQTFVD